MLAKTADLTAAGVPPGDAARTEGTRHGWRVLAIPSALMGLLYARLLVNDHQLTQMIS